MRYLKNVFLLVFIFLLSSASDGDYTFVKSVAFKNATFLSTDKFGNAYVISGNQLFQFDPKGKQLASYSENDQGSLLYVDAMNPLKLMLFYPDFGRLIILDSKLAVQSTVDLRSININEPLSACNSDDNGYWVFDRGDDQLKKVDINLQVIHQSGNLTQIIGYQIQPGMMTEDNDFVYMNNPETGILVFDRFGAYFKTIPYKNLETFQVIDKDILFLSKNKLFRYDTKSISEKEVLVPQKDSIRSVRIEQHELYLLTSDSLNFYSF